MTEHPPRIPAARTGDDAPPGQTLVGRRNRLQAAREWLLSGGSALFFGPAGVGKSAALDVLAATATQSRVLCHAPTRRDAGGPFGALVGLLSSVTAAELDSVPAARRRALTAAVAGDLGQTSPARVRLAALNLFRVLARARPLLLVVDDLQRVDELSADTLRFVASRVEDLPVQMVASERVDPGCLPLRRALCPAPLLVVRLARVALTDITDQDARQQPGWSPGPCRLGSEGRAE